MMWIPYVLMVTGLAALMWDTASRSWRSSERLDGRVAGDRPAPAVAQYMIGPAAPEGMVMRTSAAGDRYWYARELEVRPDEGATEDWSPILAAEMSGARRLPLDDVDEWLAERLRHFDHAMMFIEAMPRNGRDGAYAPAERTAAEELELFVSRSQQLSAYRQMRIGNTAEWPILAAA